MSDINTASFERKNSGRNEKKLLRMTLSLCLIAAAAALVLSAVNALTADTIAAHAAEARKAAMFSVMEEADVFSELYSADETITSLTGAYTGTRLKGYCVEVSPSGFGGDISLMVGVDLGGSVTGVVILEHSETAGLGAKADSPEFLQQYVDKSGTITVNSDHNAIQAITGATITSKAVTEGVNTALTAVFNYIAEGGAPLDEETV